MVRHQQPPDGGHAEPELTNQGFCSQAKGVGYAMHLYSRCGDGYCTSWYFEHMLLLTMLRGQYDKGIRNELLYQSTDMDLDAAIAFIEEREVEASSGTDDEVHTPDSAVGG